VVNPILNPDRIQTDTAQYNKGTGSTWPYQDLTYDKIENGLQLLPIVTNAGPANFFTPFWRGAHLAAGHIGGLQTGLFVGEVRGAPDASSTNLNYTAIQSYMSATANLGGTGLTLATAKGALFGSAFLAVAYPGATNLLNLTGCEYNTQAQETVTIKTGNQIVQMPDDSHSGAVVDAGLAFSNQGGAVNWNQVICLSHSQNGQHSVKSTGTLIGTLNGPSCATGIDFNGVIFSGNAFQSNNASIDGWGNIYGSQFIAGAATAIVGAGKLGIGTTTSATATAGTNGAPPAQVLGYLAMNLGGTYIKVPYYAV
jgi:hypothetical protein